MTLRFLLDTHILSEPLRPSPDARILDRIRRNQGDIAIASVVWHELWFGCRRLPKSARRTALENYLIDVVGPSFEILPYGAREADWHASERARLTRQGLTPVFADGQIASVAVVNDLTLVTFNTVNFKAFADLQCVDWRGDRLH